MSTKKRVYEIAKEEGLPSANVLARLQRAGYDVKTASSTVEEDWALHILSPRRCPRPDGEMPAPELTKKKAVKKPTAEPEPVLATPVVATPAPAPVRVATTPVPTPAAPVPTPAAMPPVTPSRISAMGGKVSPTAVERDPHALHSGLRGGSLDNRDQMGGGLISVVIEDDVVELGLGSDLGTRHLETRVNLLLGVGCAGA